jgi:hypothetical protein
MGSTSETVLRSLVGQLARAPGLRSVSHLVKQALEDGESGGPLAEVLTLKRCVSLLQHLVVQFRHVTMILDALDECANAKELLRSLLDVTITAKGRISLFFSSREGVPVGQVSMIVL